MVLNRRAFIAAGSAAAAGILIAGPLDAATGILSQKNKKGRVTIYRLSLRGRRGSRFAREHNANMRFITARIADLHRAHPGDRSRVVPLTISAEVYQQMFARRRAQWVDLRQL